MSVRQTTSMLPAMGVLAGLLLLGFAGVMVVSPTAQDAARRLQVAEHFGYITTSRPPSSFDSSDSSSSSDLSLEPSKSSESGSLDSSDMLQLFPKALTAIGSSMGPLTTWLILQCFFGLLYNKMVAAPIKATGTYADRKYSDERSNDSREGQGQTDFQNGFFECYKDKWVCLEVLCCPMVRMAHTNAVSGACDFWSTVACYCCCSWVTIGLGPWCLVLFWRVQLKNIMKVEDNAGLDFFGTLLCPMLSLCQMSTAVDSAMGYQMTGCCEYMENQQQYE